MINLTGLPIRYYYTGNGGVKLTAGQRPAANAALDRMVMTGTNSEVGLDSSEEVDRASASLEFSETEFTLDLDETVTEDPADKAVPFLLSRKRPEVDFSTSACIRIGTSKISKPLQLDTVGVGFQTFVPEHTLNKARKATQRLFCVGVAVDLAPGIHRKYSQIVTIRPRYVFFNLSKTKHLHLQQVEAHSGLTVAPGDQMTWHWPDRKKPKAILLALRDSTDAPVSWFRLSDHRSLPVEIEEPQIFWLRSDDEQGHVCFLRVQIQVQYKATLLVSVTDLQPHETPYCIKNDADEPLVVSQKGYYF